MDYVKLVEARNNDHSFATHIGIRTVEVQEGYAKGEMEISNDHINFINSVHGGCIFTLADTMAGAAAASHGFLVTTISGNLNYLSPAIGKKKLIGIASEVKYGKRICVYDVEILDEEEQLLAKGTFTFCNLNKPLPM